MAAQTVGEVMTPNPACCTPNATLVDAARVMASYDCGIVPVVERADTRKLLGVLTDRDLVVRGIARGLVAAEARVEDCFTRGAHSLAPEATLDECRALMERYQVRRVPIADAQGAVVGIVSLADVARGVSGADLGQALEGISERHSPQLYGEMHENQELDEPTAPAAEFTTGGRS